jgi:hypothetical protein
MTTQPKFTEDEDELGRFQGIIKSHTGVWEVRKLKSGQVIPSTEC